MIFILVNSYNPDTPVYSIVEGIRP
jgi:hypothetical protein